MRKAGQLPVQIEATVAFHDIDVAGIAWHGHYLKYFENARWALMDRLGYGLDTMLASAEGWPIVSLEVKYLRPGRFGDTLRIGASLVEWESRLVINYLAVNAATGERVARAQTTQVLVDMATGTMRYALPEAFVARVRSAIAAERAARDAAAGGSRP
jgi:acyl-CoA thioester hydrolase